MSGDYFEDVDAAWSVINDIVIRYMDDTDPEWDDLDSKMETIGIAWDTLRRHGLIPASLPTEPERDEEDEDEDWEDDEDHMQPCPFCQVVCDATDWQNGHHC